MTAPLTTNHEAERLEQAIAALEAQRSALGDAVVEAGLAPMRERLEALRRKSPTSQQRKQITVLFADISGFTSLSEASDAEDVTETINTLWGLLDNVILEHGGVIDKHMGDAVMALWGAQTAREDDAERAVRAALEMQHVIQGAGLQINNSPIQMRIGVHTGPVFLSAVGLTGEYTAMGDTVNTSSRLQHLAPLGQVVISHDTYPHVRGIFDVSPLPVVHVEGKAEPLQAYRVEGAKQRAFRMGTRGLEGVLTRMVGRDEDLQALQEAVRGLLQDGKRRLVTIVGEAGIGKSRLLYEFENWLELQPERFRFFKGRASPEMQSQPYALIRDLLAYRFGIQENDPLGAVRRKMEQGLAETGALYLRGLQIAAPASSLVPSAQAPVQAQSIQSAIEMRAYFIGQLLGYNFGSTVSGPASPGGDARQLRDRALLYLSEFFQANAQARPTLVFLEDIHWADSQSLSVAETLAKDTGGADLPGVANAACPLLIVCLTRPSLFERHSEWDLEGSPGRLQAGFARQLTLTPLSKDASRQLVTEILQKATQVPEALRELIVSGAEGNPYYVEELIKMLIDDGVIVREAEFWRVEPDRLLKVRVPSTLAGILQARLDSLAPGERAVLQGAAVIGRTFWDSVLAHLSKAAGVEELDEVLHSLCRRELIFQRKASSFAGTREYIFKHALLRDVTYESVLKRERRGYHARVAEWLIANSAGGEASTPGAASSSGAASSPGALAQDPRSAGVIADHLELAGQAEQAVQYLLQAGRLAAQRFANTEATQYLRRALNLTPESAAAEHYSIWLACERIYDLQGLRSEQTQALTALQTLAEAIQDDAAAGRRAAVALRWSNYAEVTGDYPQAINAAQTAVEQARLAHDPAREAEGILLWGRALWRRGNLSEAMSRNQEALALAKANNFKPVQAQALRTIGAIAFHQGDYANVVAPYEQALALYRELGDRRGAGSALNNLGDIARQQGDYRSAKDYFEQSISTSREIGERWSETVATSNLSLVAHNLGDQEAAREYAARALQLADQIDYRSGQGSGRTNLAHALAAMGNLSEAANLYQQALAIQQEIGQLNTSMEARAGLARVYLAQGRPAQAKEQVEAILAYLVDQTLEGTDDPFRVHLTCYQVLRATYDLRAAQVLGTAYHHLQQQAARISDITLQRSFLENVAAHAEIVQEWQKRQTPPTPSEPRSDFQEPYPPSDIDVGRSTTAGYSGEHFVPPPIKA